MCFYAEPAVTQRCEVNGCGTKWTRWIVPNSPSAVSFLPACIAHDMCYGGCTPPKRSATLTACQGSALALNPRRCCDQTFMQELQNLCTSEKLQSSVLCELLASLYYVMVRGFGSISFTGKPLAIWLRDDAPNNPEQLLTLTSQLKAISFALGDDTSRNSVTLTLSEGGGVSAEVAENMNFYANSSSVLSAAEANKVARSGDVLLYGPRIDLSGVSQNSEFSIRSKLGQNALTTIRPTVGTRQ